MALLANRNAVVLLDMAGCPNRCRHCWLGTAPNRRLEPDDLRRMAKVFRRWRKPGESDPFFERLGFASWYREPDFAPNYRELYELERELSDDNASRFELLSIWRLARDPGYAAWAREVGTEACQITFFGLEATTDWFTRRRGSFQDTLTATERLIEAGIRPRWQVILTKSFLPEAEAFVELVRGLHLEERVEGLGAPFRVFLNTPSPNGEAFAIEDRRVEAADLESLPACLVDQTLAHFGARDLSEALGRPEAELLPELAVEKGTVAERPGTLPTRLAFVVDSNFGVYTNMDETAPWCCLGHLWEDGLDTVMRRLEEDATPGLQALFQVPVAVLASRYGRPDSQCLYSPSDLLARWVRLWAQERWQAGAR